MNQKTFIFIGRSGCGKGVQSELLTKYLKKEDQTKDVLYIYSGAEFRDFIKGDSETQKLSANIMKEGGLQPEFLSVCMWTNILVEKYTGKEHLIFDGTPRKHHEAGVLDSIFDFYKLSKPYVINLDVSDEWSKKRLLERHRMDDREEDIKRRLSWYKTDVVAAIDFYRNNPRYHFIKLDGERPIQEIHEDLVRQTSMV